GKMSHVAAAREGSVPPLEPLGTVRREQEPRHARGPAPRFAPPPLHLDETLPRQPDRVLPEASVTPTVGARPLLAAGDLRLTLDPEPEGCGPLGADRLRPELALLEVAAATSGGAEGVHIDLAQVGMTHPLSRQFVRQPETSGTGVREPLRQQRLCLDREVKPILDVLLLAHGVGNRPAGRAE